MPERAYKYVCPAEVRQDVGTAMLLPCLSDVFLDYSHRGQAVWTEHSGLFDLDGGDNWWEVVCEDGHILLRPDANRTGNDPEPFDPELFISLRCPVMVSKDNWQTWVLAHEYVVPSAVSDTP
jgi:hypothetical protein